MFPCNSFGPCNNNFELIFVQNERYRHISFLCIWLSDSLQHNSQTMFFYGDCFQHLHPKSLVCSFMGSLPIGVFVLFHLVFVPVLWCYYGYHILILLALFFFKNFVLSFCTTICCVFPIPFSLFVELNILTSTVTTYLHT